jgi:hypothetical protein
MAERTHNEQGAETRLPSAPGRGHIGLVVRGSVASGLVAARAVSPGRWRRRARRLGATRKEPPPRIFLGR